MKSIKEIVIDLSGSMAKYINGHKRKIDLAKEILLDEILPYISSADEVGIRVFGGQCDMVGQLENIPNANFKKLRDFIMHQLPEPGGSTPLALAIITAVNNLKRHPEARKEIYLVTDGEETCGGDVKAAADYAARNDVKCVINVIALGVEDKSALEQFHYITTVTGGKNINVRVENASPESIERDLSPLREEDVDAVAEMIDNEFTRRRDDLNKAKKIDVRDFLLGRDTAINYIPSERGVVCQKLLVIEFFDDEKDLDNLIRGLEHVAACGKKNMEVLILMNKWDDAYYPKFFKGWKNKFFQRGVERVCIKLIGFPSYMEL